MTALTTHWAQLWWARQTADSYTAVSVTQVLYVLCSVHVQLFSHVQLCDPMDCSPPGSSVHGDSPGKNTGMGCHALLQEIFPFRVEPMSFRSPALGWWFFTNWATWKAPKSLNWCQIYRLIALASNYHSLAKIYWLIFTAPETLLFNNLLPTLPPTILSIFIH